MELSKDKILLLEKNNNQLFQELGKDERTSKILARLNYIGLKTANHLAKTAYYLTAFHQLPTKDTVASQMVLNSSKNQFKHYQLSLKRTYRLLFFLTNGIRPSQMVSKVLFDLATKIQEEDNEKPSEDIPSLEEPTS